MVNRRQQKAEPLPATYSEPIQLIFGLEAIGAGVSEGVLLEGVKKCYEGLLGHSVQALSGVTRVQENDLSDEVVPGHVLHDPVIDAGVPRSTVALELVRLWVGFLARPVPV